MAGRELSCSCKNITPVLLREADLRLKSLIDLQSVSSPLMEELLAAQGGLKTVAKDCGYQEVAVGNWVQFPNQAATLNKLGDFQIKEEHGDGDLTIKSGSKLFVVTTDGQLFEEKQI